MSWNPTHVQCTVLRARNLLPRGKSGHNDAFVIISLGKEKFQTTTIKNTQNPEWFEQCDLPIPHMHSCIELTTYHRGLLSDEFLGYVAIPLWQYKVYETPRSQWTTLEGKPLKSSKNPEKYRGEIEFKLTFTVKSKTEETGFFKKRSPSFRTFAHSVGDKLKFTRSRSYREKSEKGNDDDMHNHKSLAHSASSPASAVPQRSRSHHSAPRPHSVIVTSSIPQPQSCIPSQPETSPETNEGASNLRRSTSTPDTRKSLSRELQYDSPPSDTVKAPENSKPESSHNGVRKKIHVLPTSESGLTLPAPPGYRDAVLQGDSLVFDTINDDEEPLPPWLQTQRKIIPMDQSPPGFSPESNSQSETDNSRRAQNRMNESNKSDMDASLEMENGVGNRMDTPRKGANGTDIHIDLHNGRQKQIRESLALSEVTSGQSDGIEENFGEQQKVGNYLADAAVPEMEQVEIRPQAPPRRRKIVDVSKQYLGARRYTVQGLDFGTPGLNGTLEQSTQRHIPDPLSDELMLAYRNMTKEELIRSIVTHKAQLIRKDQYITDLEKYIDELLVRVMENTPTILQKPKYNTNMY